MDTPEDAFDSATRRAYEANRTWWDEVTDPHVRSAYYDVVGFVSGRNSLPRYVIEEVGDVQGKKLLHLQCHFGLDTLTWARLGATVTGVDFGDQAIARARELAQQLGITARFIQSNVYDLGDRLNGRFDIVFTSHGILCWLDDLAEWARIVARALKPGGLFYIAEFHPFLDTIQDAQPVAESRDLFVAYPYFNPGEPLTISGEEAGDYASSFLSGRDTFEWFHSMQEIIGSLLDAGLSVETFREQDFCVYRAREGMVRGEDGFWRMPPNVKPIPLMFSLRARKPE